MVYLLASPSCITLHITTPCFKKLQEHCCCLKYFLAFEHFLRTSSILFFFVQLFYFIVNSCNCKNIMGVIYNIMQMIIRLIFFAFEFYNSILIKGTFFSCAS